MAANDCTATNSLGRRARPPLMLASVTAVAEAELAAAGGADIIDCKDPGRGALGALDVGVVAAIRTRLPDAVISATIGDLPARPEVLLSAVQAMAATGVDYVKVGFFPGGNAAEAIAALGVCSPPALCRDGSGLAAVTPSDDLQFPAPRLPPERGGDVRLVGVLLADRQPDFGLIALMAAAGFAAVLVDTAAKDGRSLLDVLPAGDLLAFVHQAHAHGLVAGLAGSLRPAQIPELVGFGADILGFRGALCSGSDRRAAIDATRVAGVREALDAATPTITRERAGQQELV